MKKLIPALRRLHRQIWKIRRKNIAVGMATSFISFLVQLRGKETNHPKVAIVAVFLGTFMSSFHTRLFSQGLADLRGVFGLSFDEGAWLNTALNAPQMLIAPIIPFLAAVFGVRPILMFGAVGYALVTFITPFAHSYGGLLGLHIVSSLFLGLFIPTTLMIVFRNLPPRWWLAALSIYGFRLVATLNVGSPLAGLYVEYLGWEWIYWQSCLSSLLLGVLVCYSIPKENVKRAMLKIADWGGMLLFCVAFFLLYVALDNGDRLDWLNSPIITSCLLGFVVLLAYFFIHESRVAHPWAPITVILPRNLFIGVIISVIYGMVSMASALLIPSFLTVVTHLREEQAGQVLLWGFYAQFILVPLSVFTIRRVNAWYTLVFGFVCFSASCLMATSMTADWAFDDFLPVVLLMAVGHAFAFLSILAISVSNTYVPTIISFLAYIQVIRLIGPMVGSSLLVSFLHIREKTHSFFLTQNLQAGSADVEARLSMSDPITGLSSLAQVATREANVLAYIDAYYLCFAATLLALFLTAFFKRSPPNPLTPV